MPDFKTPGVYVEEISALPQQIESASTTITAFIGRTDMGPTNKPVSVRSVYEFENNFGVLSESNMLGYSMKSYFDNGGVEAIIVRPTRAKKHIRNSVFIGSSRESMKRGLYALDRVKEFNLLVIPPFNAGKNISPRILQEAVAYCQKRGAFFIIDSPFSWTDSTKAISGITALTIKTRNAAIYFPWIQTLDPLGSSQSITLPPSGAVAGTIVQTDLVRGVWKAPAGTSATLDRVHSNSISLSQTEVELLSKQSINCLKDLPGNRTVIWGSRTLAGRYDIEFKYIPVRRTMLYLEESISAGIQWAAFEPNDTNTWVRIKTMVESFLHDLFRAGAFKGASPRDAFYVKCDRTTNSPSDFREGQLNLILGVALLKPAEFIPLEVYLKVVS